MYSCKQKFFAEMIGTMFILVFGIGVNAMNVMFNLGGFVNVAFAWGIGVFLGIMVSGRISGAHLNPAITLSFAITKRFPWREVPYYITAQMLGGFLGAGLVYIFFYAKFMLFDPTLAISAPIFTTFPGVANTFLPGFIAEIVATTVLVFGILSIGEHFIAEKATGSAFAVAILIVGIGMSLGAMHGYAINPARDLSPRIFVTLMGFQHTGLINSTIWLAPVLGSLIGAPLGAILFDITLAKK